MKKKINEEEGQPMTEDDLQELLVTANESALLKETLKELGNIFFMGEVNEETANGLISSMITFKELTEKMKEAVEETAEETAEAEEGAEEEKAEPEEPNPIKVYISTQGGNADDMFAIYDVMEMVKRSVPIQTIGLGKVMSAGVLLLAAGTKGKRKIGRHARVMIHNVITGHSGGLFHVANELGEAEHIQQMYISAIAENSNLTVKQLRKMVKTGQNVYLSAQEAIKYGIADELI